MDRGKKLRALGPRDIQDVLSQGACLLDIRESTDFGHGHLRGSINIQFSSKSFAERVALLVPPESPLVLVEADGARAEAAALVLREAGVGNLLGYAAGGVEACLSAGLPAATLPQISIHELRQWLEAHRAGLAVLDVREPFEWEDLGHIQGAILIPLGEVEKRRGELPVSGTLAVVCERGLRSSSALSLLLRHGVEGCINVTEGMAGWREAGYPVVT